MRFMIMVSGSETELRGRSPESIERMTAYMARLDDELASSGELVWSEVLEYGSRAATVDARAGILHGAGIPLYRFWVVAVAVEARAVEIATGLAAATDTPVEVRGVFEPSQRP